MKKWNVPLTYQPKIEPVRQGTIRQTIRTGRKYNIGDLIRFYVWEGKPYRSKRHNITDYMEINDVVDILLVDDGIIGLIVERGTGREIMTPWCVLEYLSKLDGIVPPTGEALRDVLISKNGHIPAEGIEAQIIRWLP